MSEIQDNAAVAVIEAANAKCAAFAARWKAEYPALAAGIRNLLEEEQEAWAALREARHVVHHAGDAELPEVLTTGFCIAGDRDFNVQMGNQVRLPSVTGDFREVDGELPFWSPPHTFSHL